MSEKPENQQTILIDLDFTEEDIRNRIKALKPNSAAGSDGVSATLLQRCSETLSYPLYLLWKKSMTTGIVPLKLKAAIITPIHKGGDKCRGKNYRPIALTKSLSMQFSGRK